MNNWHLEGKRTENFKNVLESFKMDLGKVLASKLYCVAGTMTSVGNMYLNNKDFIESEVNGLEFEKTDIDAIIQRYQSFSPEEFLDSFPFLGKRSKTIMSGLYLAQGVLEVLGVENVYISTYGLRYGTLLAGEIKDEFIQSI